MDAHLVKLRAKKALDSYVEAIEKLDPNQRRVLVHLASPPAIEVVPSHGGDHMDLFDLGGPAWVSLAGGAFTMGSNAGRDNEKPEHPAEVSPFRMGRFPVTNAQYAVYAHETGKKSPQHWEDGAIPEGKAQHPVTYVSWDDATAFSVWLSERIARTGAEGQAGLPREAEWEFAARGAEGRAYPWGLEEPTVERANFDTEVGDTTAVGAYPKGATPEGVHDLAGNVWEWCHDWYGDYSEAPKRDYRDYNGPERGTGRVVRGGSFGIDTGYLRGAYRFYYVPRTRLYYAGFRVVWRVPGGLS